MIKRCIILSALMITSYAATAQKDTVTVIAQWLPQAQFAGIIMAYEKGFYEEAGIEAEIKYVEESVSSTDMLESGEADIITSMLVDALIARDMGLPLVNILQTSGTNSCMFISHTPLNDVHDLDGMRVASWAGGFYETAMCFANYKSLNIEWIPILSNIYPFSEGAVDAMVATEYNEYFQIMMAGIDIDEDNIIYLRDEGYDIPEDGVYTTEEYYSSHKDVVDRFVQATVRGWEWVRNPENQDETVDTITRIMKKKNIPTSNVNQKYMLNTVLRLQEDSLGNVPYRLDKSRFDFTVRMLKESNFILRTINYDDFVRMPDTDR